MKLVFSILLISGFVALSHAACDVCACTEAPPFFSTESFLVDLPLTIVNRTVIQPTGFHVENCELILQCGYDGEPSADGKFGFYTDYYPATAGEGIDVSFTTDLSGMKCNGGIWEADKGPVQYVGCHIDEKLDLPMD